MLSRCWAYRGLAIVIIAVLLLAVVPGALAEGEQTYTLRILHTNDHHSHLEAVKVDDKTFGGIAQRKTLIDQARKQTPGALLLDAGDVFQGSAFFTQFNGKADLYFYNQLKYDAQAVGNHEFDKGQQVLAEYVAEASFPVLSANLVIDPSSPLSGKVKRWTVKQAGNEKIGIFGLTSEETPTMASVGPGVEFVSATESAAQAVAELNAQGVNKVIALTHLGFDADRQLAREVAGIDVIVGGHSHTPLGPQPAAKDPYPVVEDGPDGAKVVVVTDWEWGKWLGDLKVGFDAAGRVTSWQGKPIPVDATVAADPAFDAKLKEYAASLDKARKTVIGKSLVALDGSRDAIRSRETNLGNLVADAMLEKTRSAGAQIAIMNGGGIRTGIPAGDMNLGQVQDVLPFGNTLAWTDLTGVQILAALENGVSQVESGAGRFPQVAGMRFSWNPAAPPGQRIVNMEVLQDGGYVSMNLAGTYRVVTNDFMIGGGDGYSALATGLNAQTTGDTLADALVDLVKARSPLEVGVEGRIIRLGEEPEAVVSVQDMLSFLWEREAVAA